MSEDILDARPRIHMRYQLRACVMWGFVLTHQARMLPHHAHAGTWHRPHPARPLRSELLAPGAAEFSARRQPCVLGSYPARTLIRARSRIRRQETAGICEEVPVAGKLPAASGHLISQGYLAGLTVSRRRHDAHH